MKNKKIISGCQTGVDRLALEIATALGIKTSGYVPLNMRSEITDQLTGVNVVDKYDELNKPLQFHKDYLWIFSNFYVGKTKIVDEYGIEYNCVENYYQASKTLDIDVRKTFTNITPGESKRQGKNIKNLRPKWDYIKYEVMNKGLIQKFKDPDLLRSLQSTGETILVEWTYWGDTIWGMCDKRRSGKNALGKLLTELRETSLIETYNLIDTGIPNYQYRTEQNVINSDGTVYFKTDDDSAGFFCTINYAKQHNKPYLVNPTVQEFIEFISNKDTVNVAGNRGSKLNPDLTNEVINTLSIGLQQWWN